MSETTHSRKMLVASGMCLYTCKMISFICNIVSIYILHNVVCIRSCIFFTVLFKIKNKFLFFALFGLIWPEDLLPAKKSPNYDLVANNNEFKTHHVKLVSHKGNFNVIFMSCKAFVKISSSYVMTTSFNILLVSLLSIY